MLCMHSNEVTAGGTAGKQLLPAHHAALLARAARTCLALQAPRLVDQLALQGQTATLNIGLHHNHRCKDSRATHCNAADPQHSHAQPCSWCARAPPLTWNKSWTQVRTGRLRCAAALAAAWLSICRLGLRPCSPPPPPLLPPPAAAALVGLRACLVGEAARLLLRLLLREPSREERRLAACRQRDGWVPRAEQRQPCTPAPRAKHLCPPFLAPQRR